MDFFGAVIRPVMEKPGLLLGHFTYALLIISMLMRNIAWLRGLAVGSGLAKIAYRYFFVFDPVSLFWEAIFVLVNLSQLLLIMWENRIRPMSEEEERFISVFKPKLTPAVAMHLLRTGSWHEVEAGQLLTQQGEPLNALIYISAGSVRIEADGRVVAHCGPGDFLGEMTLQDGAPATGTAIAEGVVRYLRFERDKIHALQNRRPLLGHALQASFNRNLITKLVRTNQRTASPA